MALMLTGCAGTLRGADMLGRIGADIDLPAQPTECAQRVPHIALGEGQELRSLLKRERAQLDVANSRLLACWKFNEDVRAGFAGRAD
jgi:hypothetical protein